MSRLLLKILMFVCLLAVAAGNAQAVHLDIEIRGEGDRLAVGYCMTAGVGCDLPGALGRLSLPKGTLPLDSASGYKIFAADFGDPLKPYETKNPGFHAVENALIPRELIRYQALGQLLHWSPDRKQWAPADAGVRVRLFGGIDAKTVIRQDYSACDGLLVCIPKELQETVYEEGSTAFSAAGIGGAETLLIDDAGSKGSLHTHLDWFLENAAGTAGGPRGAYLATLQLRSERRPQPSEPFLIVFNNGLSDEDLAAAIAARMVAPETGVGSAPTPAPDPTPEPQPNPTPVLDDHPDAGASSNPSAAAFRSFAYRESGSEKLTACRPDCRKSATGSTQVQLAIDLDDPAAVQRLELGIGTTTLITIPAPNLEDRLVGAKAGPSVLGVRDGTGRAVGKLRVSRARGQIRLLYKLPRATLLAEDFMGGVPGSVDGIESVLLKAVGGDAREVAAWRATLELQGTLTRRSVRRNGGSHVVDSVRLSGRGG